MIVIRKPNWEYNLWEYIEKCKTRRFRYGSHDCVRFSAGAVKVMTGINVLERAPEYNNRKTADGLLKSVGLFDRTSDLLEQYPIQEKNVGHAITGDVVGFYNEKAEEQVGVMCDTGSFVSVSKDGTVFFPVDRVIICWSI